MEPEREEGFWERAEILGSRDREQNFGKTILRGRRAGDER